MIHVRVSEPGVAATHQQPFNAWRLLLVGVAAMYVPIYWSASQNLWQSDELGHGPIILGLVAWLFWQARRRIVAQATRPAHALGWPQPAGRWSSPVRSPGPTRSNRWVPRVSGRTG